MPGYVVTPLGSAVLDPRQTWGWVLARGGFAVVFGIIALLWPGVTALALAFVFGIYALVDAVGAFMQAFRPGDGMHRAAYALFGVLGLAAGVVALVWPGVTILVLAIVVGAWAVVTGVAEIVAAIRLRKQITGEGFLVFAGVVSVIAGVLVLFHPIAGAYGIALLVGIYALVYGIMLVVLAFRLRRWGKREQANQPA
ncbi:HdeD family acid-resistance protein [Amycolatopsis sp. FDAARGOS 1241]|uniref:HdeD family acid-resistance protein n=1 Tax=Amycolatopsis sp. FDAARGOS 1241 TaxID=2778070 RepID=UPI00195135DF|nr:HdeD family acid-resistance protein [Amycolatopsis sp. FDAARGOS 1241]QRP43543.1 HdeD family acid-resistance protein [Amycolatopsis sp. FDAARGOS 1241]